MEEEVRVPLRNGEEAVALTSSQLPDNVNEIIDLLRSEQVKLSVWLHLAVVYYKNQKFEQFLQILKTGATQNYGENAEKIAILESLAAYYIELAKNTVNKEQKNKYQDEASHYLNKADRIQVIRDEVGKAVLLLQKGDAKRAFFSFGNNVMASFNVPSLLGRAAILYHHGSYKEALELYKKALEMNPNCPPAVRNGLALCYYKLGRVNLARKWFERVLEMEGGNIDAKLALAIIEMNSDTIGCIKRAYQVISKLYNDHPNHARVLNLLSNYYLHRNDFQKAEWLAMRAIQNSDVAKIRAESYYLLAKKFHTQNQYEEAFDYYQKSIALWGDFPLALFGLAQMEIFYNRVLNALTLLEKLNELCPNNIETLKLLSSLYLSLNQNYDLSKQYLKKVVEKRPNDVIAHIELARLCEKNDVKTSLASYEKAAKIIDSNNDFGADQSALRMTLELWNNIGVLRYRLGDLKGSEIAYLKSIEYSGLALLSFDPINITTTYNLARVYEGQHRFREAQSLYLGVLKHHPTYLDAYFRLANIAMEIGQFQDAIGWINFSFSIDPANITAWTILGSIYVKKKDSQNAQRTFEQILKKFDKNDAYSLLSLASIFFNAKFHKKEKATRYLELAEKYYWRVLKTHNNNFVALNGLAMVLAERGLLRLSMDCFMSVKESAPSFPDVWINLAHIFIKQKQFSNAISLYSKSLQKFYCNQNDHLLVYLSFAYYLNRDYRNAKRVITKAIHLLPTNLNFWYNLAIILKSNAKSILYTAAKKTSSKVPIYEIISLEEVEEGLNDIQRAKDILSTLIERSKQSKVKRNFSSRECGKIILKLDHLQKKSIKVSDSVRKKREILLEKERKMQEEFARKHRELNEGELNKKKLLKEQQKEMVARLAQSHAEMLSLMQQEWSQSDSQSKKRKKKDHDDDESPSPRSPSSESDQADDDQSPAPAIINNNNNNNNGVDQYGSNALDMSLFNRNASHLQSLIAETTQKKTNKHSKDDNTTEMKESTAEEEEEDGGDDEGKLGFSVELIKEFVQNPDKKTWLQLKSFLVNHGVDPAEASAKRKLILNITRKYSKKAK